MKLKVLIPHNSLNLSDNSLTNYHYYIGQPDTACSLNEALDKIARYSFSLVIVEVTPPWKFAAEPPVILKACTPG